MAFYRHFRREEVGRIANKIFTFQENRITQVPSAWLKGIHQDLENLRDKGSFQKETKENPKGVTGKRISKSTVVTR